MAKAMHKDVRKQYEELYKNYGLKVTAEDIKQMKVDGVQKLLDQGLPKKVIANMLKRVTILGDFAWFEARLPFDAFNEFFGGAVRDHGIDGSIHHHNTGASASAAILNISPHQSAINVWNGYFGIKDEVSDYIKMVFKAGHCMEPVYRAYFGMMYGYRYQVITCDLQMHIKGTHIIINVDGLLIDKETGEFGILEIKHSATCW